MVDHDLIAAIDTVLDLTSRDMTNDEWHHYGLQGLEERRDTYVAQCRNEGDTHEAPENTGAGTGAGE